MITRADFDSDGIFPLDGTTNAANTVSIHTKDDREEVIRTIGNYDL